jgi:hypothetical protein
MNRRKLLSIHLSVSSSRLILQRENRLYLLWSQIPDARHYHISMFLAEIHISGISPEYLRNITASEPCRVCSSPASLSILDHYSLCLLCHIRNVLYSLVRSARGESITDFRLMWTRSLDRGHLEARRPACTNWN